MEMEVFSCCAHSLSDNMGHPLGPESLVGLRLINLEYTTHGVKSMSVRESMSRSKLNEGT